MSEGASTPGETQQRKAQFERLFNASYAATSVDSFNASYAALHVHSPHSSRSQSLASQPPPENEPAGSDKDEDEDIPEYFDQDLAKIADLYLGYHTEERETTKASDDGAAETVADNQIVLAREEYWRSRSKSRALPIELPRDLGNTRADPFDSFPFILDDTQIRLVDFYVHDYARTNLNMSRNVQPGKKYFGDLVGSPIELHAILSSSALQLLFLSNSEAASEIRPLQVAALHHKGEAIHEINEALGIAVTEPVMSATLSIARDELRHGSLETANVHFEAARRMLRTYGGRWKLTYHHLLLQVRGIECAFSPPEVSGLFDQSDLPARVRQLKAFISRLYRKGVERSTKLVQHQVRSPYESFPFPYQVLRPDTLFYHLLTKDVPDPQTVKHTDVAEINAQLAVVIEVAAAWLHTKDTRKVRDYIDYRNSMLVKMGIERDDSIINAHNLIRAQATSIQLMQKIGQVWFHIDVMNAARYLSFAWRLKLRDWLLRLLEGAKPEKLEKLDAFAFSYMTS